MAEANQIVLKVLNDLKEKTGLGGVVDKWSDGQGNWWRKYADGWIEQGGKITFSAVQDWFSAVTLHKEMTTADYQVLITPLTTVRSNNNPCSGFIGSTVLTTTTFIPKFYGDNPSETIIGWAWFACGY